MSGTLNPTKFVIEPYISTKDLREESERSWRYMLEKYNSSVGYSVIDDLCGVINESINDKFCVRNT